MTQREKTLVKFVKTWVSSEKKNRGMKKIVDIMGISTQKCNDLASILRTRGVELPHIKDEIDSGNDYKLELIFMPIKMLVGVLAKARGTTIDIEKANSMAKIRERLTN